MANSLIDCDDLQPAQLKLPLVSMHSIALLTILSQQRDKPPGKRTVQSVIVGSRFDDFVVQNDDKITLNRLSVVTPEWNISFIAQSEYP